LRAVCIRTYWAPGLEQSIALPPGSLGPTPQCEAKLRGGDRPGVPMSPMVRAKPVPLSDVSQYVSQYVSHDREIA